MLDIDRNLPDQDPFSSSLRAYLERTLHVPVDLAPWQGGAELPIFLTRNYTLYQLEIGDTRLVVLASDREDPRTPNEISKHIGLVEAAFAGPVVYAANVISSTLRARLIDAGVAFIAPGNQLYIPLLAMDLREHFRRPRAPRPEKLSPSAQAVLFRHVLFIDEHDRLYGMTPSALADPLRYSPMTIGRAFDELAAVGLAKIERQGREKHLRFNEDGRLLIDMAKTLLISPVSKTIPVRLRADSSEIQYSGLTALERLTDLNSDEPETFAVTPDRWRTLLNQGVVEPVSETYEATAVIETWRYDPQGLSERSVVDPLSLYAQFWDHEDERVSMAADQLLEAFEW